MKVIYYLLFGLILLLILIAAFLALCGIIALKENAEDEIFYRVYSFRIATFAFALSCIWSLL